MANTRIQVKRTSTSGRVANTSDVANSTYIAAGEFALNMADGILYSSNGSSIIEIGANNTIMNVTGSATVLGTLNANGGIVAEGTSATLTLATNDASNTGGQRTTRIYGKNFVGNNLITVVFQNSGSATSQNINWGGGTGLAEPVTAHFWYTNSAAVGTIGTGTARMALISNGNLGIGTTVPSTKLDVVGDAKISSTLSVGGILTQNGISTRVVNYASGTTLTINTDTTDVANTYNTEAAGTLTMAIPTGTPTDGQKLLVVIRSTNVQTFSWTIAGANSFDGSDDLPLPTATSGSSKYDYLGFIYASATQRWRLLAKNFGF